VNARLFVARRSFVTHVDGHQVVVRAGHTHVTEDDPRYLANPQAFRLMDPEDPPVEQATAAPGEKRQTRRAVR